jgi:hypothetical protein
MGSTLLVREAFRGAPGGHGERVTDFEPFPPEGRLVAPQPRHGEPTTGPKPV